MRVGQLIIIYNFYALIDAISAYMIHLNLSTIFYIPIEQNPANSIYIKFYMKPPPPLLPAVNEMNSHISTCITLGCTHTYTRTRAHTHTLCLSGKKDPLSLSVTYNRHVFCRARACICVCVWGGGGCLSVRLSV